MDELWKYIASQGVLGVILAWFMLRTEIRLKAIEDAIVRQGKIDLLRMASSPHVAPELKDVAKDVLREIDESLERQRR